MLHKIQGYIMQLNLKTKLTLAFSSILCVIIITSIFTLNSVSHIDEIQEHITEDRIVNVNSAKGIDIGIYKSLSALRGYMILGSDSDKADLMRNNRIEAWKTIDTDLKKLHKNESHLSTTNQNVLKQLDVELEKFKLIQQDIENIAQTPENIPAYELLLNEAAPKATEILQAITNIINIESTLQATKERKELLKLFADSRGSFAIGIANIRAYLLSGDPIFKQKFEDKWKINTERFNQINDLYKDYFTNTQNIQWDIYQVVREEFSALPPQMFSLREAKNWNQANYLLSTQAAPTAKNALDLLQKIEQSQAFLLENEIDLLHDLSDNLNAVIYMSAAFSILISIGMGIFITKNMLSRILPILYKARKITDNQLDSKPLSPKGNDELTELTIAINAMSYSLIKTIELTALAMEDTSQQADSIYDANTDMSTDINHQNEQINLIASAIEELSASASEVSQSSNFAALSAQQTHSTAQKGGEIVNHSLQQMSEISDAFDDSSASVLALSEQSKEIAEILDVISGIAEQTNLLALNAAIEAARAGEQGRGFAVVADEVRNLASRTTKATANVEIAIEQMRSHTDSSVKNMTLGRDKVTSGIEESQRVAKILTEIINYASETSSQVESIATAAKQQSTVTSEIASNSDQASRMSHQVSSQIDKVVTLSKDVSNNTNNNAAQLKDMVG